MNKITAAYFGVLVLAICLSTQVKSQNATVSAPMANQTSDSTNYNATTMATNTYSSVANSTTPIGAGPSLQPNTFFLLLPIAMVTSLLHLCC
ncbi:hypothetical protein MATL_G00200120 [Megalops atlanticus]|uniref:Uncharacterized protein n=1 Tax=Megalops atlanticus TaxID=7932 RepID=A0A9D3T403_MEGAT|nr:hypothetical protein MATL_G00200120 [Megalops atlanticus]